MIKLRDWVTILGIVASLAIGSGCKAKSKPEQANAEDAPAIQAAQSLPDGTNILAALNQGDYDTAAQGVMKLQQSIESGPAAVQVETLKMYVKSRLIQLAPTDPKANDALNALRAATAGR
jgi:hypothetical protein